MNADSRSPRPPSTSVSLPDSFEYLLIPGFGGTGRLFEPLVASGAFTRRPEVCPYPAGAKSVAEIAQSIRARPRNWERTVIITESLGGVVAVELCARLPTPPAAMVFSAAFATAPRPLVLRMARLLPAGILRRIGRSGAAIRVGCADGGDPDLIGAARSINEGLGADVWRTRLAMIATADVRTQLAKIALPVCYLRASRDRLIPARATDEFCSLLANVTRVEVAGPHFLLQTAPLACLEVIARFLESVARR